MKLARGLVKAFAVVFIGSAALNVGVACSDFGATTDSADGADSASRDGSNTPDGADAPAPDAREAAVPCPEGGIVKKARCYFIISDLVSRPSAASECAAQQAELATFTSAEEWVAAGGIGRSNYWLGAAFDGTKWTWSNGEPFVFWPNGGAYFDASPPQEPSATCLWRNQGGDWTPAPCSATSAGAYCERPQD